MKKHILKRDTPSPAVQIVLLLLLMPLKLLTISYIISSYNLIPESYVYTAVVRNQSTTNMVLS